jgi:hypothetical protein
VKAVLKGRHLAFEERLRSLKRTIDEAVAAFADSPEAGS